MQTSIYEELTSHLSELESIAVEKHDSKALKEIYEVKYLIDLVFSGENMMEDIGVADSRHEQLIKHYQQKLDNVIKENFVK